MEITLNYLGTCPGGNHVHLDVTIDGVTRSIAFTKDELLAADTTLLTDTEEKAVLKAIRRYAKQGNIKNIATLTSRLSNLSLSL